MIEISKIDLKFENLLILDKYNQFVISLLYNWNIKLKIDKQQI